MNMKTMATVFVALNLMLPVVVLAFRPADTMRTLDKGDQSNMDDARRAVARTDAEWTALWQQHSPDRKRPAVDFSTEMVVGVFLGSRPTAGYILEIISAAPEGGALVVRYREKMPPAGAVTAQVITSYYHLVAVPKAAGTVKFEKTPD